MRAAASGELARVSELLAWGAEPHAEARGGGEGRVGSSLHHAAAANQAAAAELLLLSGAKVDLPSTEDGGTPLHWSSGADAGKAALLLLEHGSSPHALDAHGNTPLEAAMVNGKISSPKLLELLAV